MQPDDPIRQPTSSESPSQEDLTNLERDTTEIVQPAQTVPVVATKDRRKGLAITSLVLSIIGFLTGILIIGIFLGIIGLVLGIISLAKKRGGKGVAIAGVAIGGLTLVLAPISIIITLTAYNGVQQRAKETMIRSESRHNDYDNHSDYR